MYSVTIVGGGQISSGYDNPNDKNILTHIHGALEHNKIILDAVVEISEKRQDYIVNKWGDSFKVYDTLEKSINEHKSNIFIVATPTHTHLKIIESILDIYIPKLIVCEKPIVANLEELEKLNTLIEENNIKIITNFPRRFDKSLNILKTKILTTNKKYHFYGIFTKGLIHNGSHMIDLISMLVGKIYNISQIKKEIIDGDIFGQFLVETDSCKGVISNINNEKLSVFELTIYTEIFKIMIIGTSQKIEINYINKSSLTQGFETYSLKKEIPFTLNKSAYNTFEYVIDLLEDEIKYEKFQNEQYNVNKLIFNTQKKLMEEI